MSLYHRTDQLARCYALKTCNMRHFELYARFMSGTNSLKGDTAYSTKDILLPATLNCLLSVSCIVISLRACVCSTLGRPQSCNSCFCNFLSFILPPAAKIARLALFFHLSFAPDAASAASPTSAAQLAWLSQQEGLCWFR